LREEMEVEMKGYRFFMPLNYKKHKDKESEFNLVENSE